MYLLPPRETALEGDRRVGDMCCLYSTLEGDRRFGDMCCLFFVAGCSAKGGNAAISTSSWLETFGVAPPLSRRFRDPKMRFPAAEGPLQVPKCPPAAALRLRGGTWRGPSGAQRHPKSTPWSPKSGQGHRIERQEAPGSTSEQ